MSDTPSVVLEAKLCVWRIFGVGHDFTDKNPPWSTSSDAGPNSGDTLSVVIGDIPPHILDALRTWRGFRPYLLNTIYGQHYAGMSIEETITVIERFIAEVDLSDVTESFPLFVTFELSRPIQIEADPTAKFFWVREGGPNLEAFQEFGRTASKYLETAVAYIQAHLGDQLRLDRVTFGEDRAYLVAPGKAAATEPRSRGAASATLLSSG